MFRTVSQTAVNYRGSSLSEGRAGAVHGGDRLPWVEPGLPAAGGDNFTPLDSVDWQVHVYGEASADIRIACAQRKLPLHVFAWRPAMRRTGLRRDAVYLVRPDGYIARADATGSAKALTGYLDVRKLRPRTPS
jgi:hypothetical protein